LPGANTTGVPSASCESGAWHDPAVSRGATASAGAGDVVVGAAVGAGAAVVAGAAAAVVAGAAVAAGGALGCGAGARVVGGTEPPCGTASCCPGTISELSFIPFADSNAGRPTLSLREIPNSVSPCTIV
jgi:hypothetical protein